MQFPPTPIFEYNLETGKTTNRTEENLGYDTAPQFSLQVMTLVANEK
jgi:hypothetical protein